MNNLHCHSIERAGDQDSGAAPVDSITLDETDRHRRRLAMHSDNGIAFLLELGTATLLREGDILRLSDGRGIKVLAQPEALYRVYGRDSNHLLHLTWHVGNRHLATQIVGDHILIRRDPVIRNMLEELGARVEDVEAGFNPVGGAYDGEQESTHHHSHAPGHEHEHHHHGHSHD